MLWPGSTRPSVPSSAAPVPDPEALRRAVLQTSWRRDRRVARRRLWFRWTLWGLQTYAWQIAATAAVLAALAVWLWPAGSPPAASPAPEPGALPQRPGPTAPAASTAPGASAPASAPSSALSNAPDSALPLKLERRWRPDPLPGPSAAGPSTAPADAPAPTLKPDNWLHSKEP